MDDPVLAPDLVGRATDDVQFGLGEALSQAAPDFERRRAALAGPVDADEQEPQRGRIGERRLEDRRRVEACAHRHDTDAIGGDAEIPDDR